jgi:hypothetical protein
MLPELPSLVKYSKVGGKLQIFWWKCDQLFHDPWHTDAVKRGFQFNLKNNLPLMMDSGLELYLDDHSEIL